MEKETLKRIFDFFEKKENLKKPFVYKLAINEPFTEDDLNVKGNLYFPNSKKITSLPKGLKVEGDLSLANTRIRTLPEGLEVLYCDQNLLTSLPNIPTTLKILVGYNNCFIEDIILPKNLKFKNVQSRLILDKKHYGINKTEVDEFILNNSRINRSNCKCGKYIALLFKKYSEELSNEFKTFAYYYEDNRRCGDCDRHYTCGFCCKKYRIERPGHSFYFQG